MQSAGNCWFADATSGNYQPVQLEGRGEYVKQLTNGTLRIIKALEDDHGYYLCHASNGIGIGISKVVFLRVHSQCWNCLLLVGGVDGAGGGGGGAGAGGSLLFLLCRRSFLCFLLLRHHQFLPFLLLP